MPSASIKFTQANLVGEGAEIRLAAMYGFRSKGLYRFELMGSLNLIRERDCLPVYSCSLDCT